MGELSFKTLRLALKKMFSFEAGLTGPQNVGFKCSETIRSFPPKVVMLMLTFLRIMKLYECLKTKLLMQCAEHY